MLRNNLEIFRKCNSQNDHRVEKNLLVLYYVLLLPSFYSQKRTIYIFGYFQVQTEKQNANFMLPQKQVWPSHQFQRREGDIYGTIEKKNLKNSRIPLQKKLGIICISEYTVQSRVSHKIKGVSKLLFLPSCSYQQQHPKWR